MATVFSWKMPDGKYAYLVKDIENDTYIRDCVTDNETLKGMIDEVEAMQWNVYEQEFNALSEEVIATYGVDLGGYEQYYYVDVMYSANKQCVLIDGTCGIVYDRPGSTVMDKSLYLMIKKMIDDKFDEYKAQLESSVSNAVVTISSNINESVSDSMNEISATKSELNDKVSEVNDIVGSAQELYDTINFQSLQFANAGLSMSDVVNTLTGAQVTNRFVEDNGTDLQTIKNDYLTMDDQNNGNGKFFTLNNNVSQNSDFIEENRLVITDVANYAAGQTGTTIGSVVQTEATQIANSIVSQAVSDITNIGGSSQQGGSLD